ncbi:homocysteine S-methyltransferase [Oceanimonas doudoroffii]|uniref:S-methylmethionine:homocysteine methyltransferase n=1 Tax=Oceanimonas doudoroffii TaxID=84158 RepID=A0A233REB5_9GAMM|nr:homocysteine S-methyltransferase [Oceanimonas doudoroffii]OXY81737.1 homocysteine S-methyltransferase [Oceanimonas doudoroffii]
MSNPIEALLAQHSLAILDGALATELEARGCDLKDPLWSAKILIEQPELIYDVHYDYFAAGADVAISASYQATFEAFARRGLDTEQAAELMHQAVRLATRARDNFWNALNAEQQNRRPRPLVAASVGPYGAMLADGSEYRGHYALTEEELMAFHRPRLEVLLAAGADLLACETLPCLSEARALARLMDAIPDACGWISFSCQSREHNCQGERLSDCVAALEPYHSVVAIGLNCTAPEHVPGLLRSVQGVSRKPLLVYPNSGEQYDADHKCWHGPVNSEQYAGAAEHWHREGARLIGGCCRTSPADIAAVSARLRPQQ